MQFGKNKIENGRIKVQDDMMPKEITHVQKSEQAVIKTIIMIVINLKDVTRGRYWTPT